MKGVCLQLFVLASALPLAPRLAAAPKPADLEFFEKQVRPTLAENCYACHSAKAPAVFAGLRLDSRAAVVQGGDAGPVVVVGDPSSSKLVRMLHGEGLQMPPTGKLPADKIAALERWIELGLPWPEEAAPAPDPSAKFDLEQRRSEHWAWQPVRKPAIPNPTRADWASGAVDRFLLSRLEQEGLQPAEVADRRSFIRRASFDLTGLPPTPQEIAAYLADDAPDADERLIDRLLASPHYGERQARLWMDLMRYAESHGSEGDPDTREAWRYRDYLIRAFNEDVPYDQLVREHLAGDLLAEPRIDSELGLNESLLATAHWRLVEHGFQPVDPWEDRVKWTDNQIDVLSKTFLGLTVSCARCHDHKFDAISQKDYYALFGTIKNARPTMRAVESPERLDLHRERLTALKGAIRAGLAKAWAQAAEGLGARLEQDHAVAAVEAALQDSAHPLRPWAVLRGAQGEAFREGWRTLVAARQAEMDARRAYNAEHFETRWDLRHESDFRQWLGHGEGLPAAASKPGEIDIAAKGPQVIGGVLQPGAWSHRISSKHGAVLQSPRFKIETDYISFETAGEGWSNAQLIIENYAVPRAGIYHLRYRPKSRDLVWSTWKTDYWKGFTAYFELATQQEITQFQMDAEDSQTTPRPKPNDDGRSWFGAGAIVFHNQERTPRSLLDPLAPLLSTDPAGPSELAAWYSQAVGQAVEAWSEDHATAEQAALLDALVRAELLPNRLTALEDLRPLVAEYRKLEAEIPVARRAPGVVDEGGDDQPLLIRGQHKRPGDPVPRRFLTALGGQPYDDPRLARLRLAEAIACGDNPLAARVQVNRLWRQMFGDGIVRTEDNFGKLGEAPTHPELLDYLAGRYVAEGWSTKQLLRELATSRAYRMSSLPSAAARERDPGNKLLSHMPVRRLEAEQIRDAILAASGELDPALQGRSIPVYYAYATGKTKGDNPKGPLDGDGRRSIYQEIRRNSHNPFLEVFDLPKPATARPQRDVTNVPAQSLTMLNSPFVIGQAKKWGEKVAASPDGPSQRVGAMFEQALGRPPSPQETDRALSYLAAADGGRLDAQAWADLAQSLFNLKEFLYVR
ncbi:MAG: DUF1553 domain-containing protein [Acidobacteria bacterium]|nr:DUF1553 domain-containing protein [Acidobacteriota bacterium]